MLPGSAPRPRSSHSSRIRGLASGSAGDAPEPLALPHPPSLAGELLEIVADKTRGTRVSAACSRRPEPTSVSPGQCLDKIRACCWYAPPPETTFYGWDGSSCADLFARMSRHDESDRGIRTSLKAAALAAPTTEEAAAPPTPPTSPPSGPAARRRPIRPARFFFFRAETTGKLSPCGIVPQFSSMDLIEIPCCANAGRAGRIMRIGPKHATCKRLRFMIIPFSRYNEGLGRSAASTGPGPLRLRNGSTIRP